MSTDERVLRFRSLGFRVWGLGFRVLGLRAWYQYLGFWGLGPRRFEGVRVK